MSEAVSLSEIFLDCAPPGHASWLIEPAVLEHLLTSIWESARAAWPTLAIARPAFVHHLVSHLPESADAKESVADFLSSLHASDLYLAYACAVGSAAAIAAFERSILSQVPSFLARMSASPQFAEEIQQLLREKLLVASAGAPPKISEYAGTGALRSWVRVVAIRTAVSLRRNRDEQPKESLDVGIAKSLPVGQDAELDYIRTRYQSEFKDALRAAFASLPKEQRHVLRMHFAGELTGDAIAAVLQVNRRTVGRWLASAKTAMFHETRRILQSRLRLSPGELDSLVRMIRTSFDLSLSSLLRSGDAPP